MVQQAFRVDQVSTSNIEFKSNSFISSIAADATLASNVHLVLPTSVGSSGQVLATDGSGNLSFVSQGVGGPADLVQDNVNSLTSTVDSFGVYANNTFGADGSNVSVANVTSQEFSIDGSTNTFTLVNTTDNVNKLLVSYGGIAQKPSEYAVSNTSLTLSNTRPLVAGTTVEVRYLDFEFSGSVTPGGGGGGGVISGTSYYSTLYSNTTAGLTTFNEVSTPSLPAYTVGKIGVYVNGVKLANNSFTATTGNSVVLDNSTLLGDDVEIVNFGMSSASIDDLTDVDLTTNAPANGQALIYVSANSKWEPGSVASSYGDSDVDTHLNQSTASTDQVLSWDGSDYAWVDQSAGGSSGASTPALTDYEFTATANQTSFAATYIPGSVQVFLNGVKLANTEFTATSGTSIVLGSNTASGDTISVSKIGGSSNLTVANASASSTGSISYDSGSEVLTYTPPDLSGYQSTLVSNTNIKTINGNSVLGSGNITISSGGGVAGTLGSLTKSFANNESATITLSSNVSPVPNVSVFKEVPQQGFSSKGQWDVNANATNYDFFDEKPISYASSTLTPSATGDGTFTISPTSTTTYTLQNSSYSTGFSITSQTSNPRDVAFKNDGTKMYVLHSAKYIYEYSLSTAYDVTTASYVGSINLGPLESAIFDTYGLRFKSDGTKVYVLDYYGKVWQFSLSTAWSISTTTYDSVSITGVVGSDGPPYAFTFKPDGTKLFAVADRRLYEWVLSTAWDLSSASISNQASGKNADYLQFTTYTNANSHYAFDFAADGTKFVVQAVGSNGSSVGTGLFEVPISSAWDPLNSTSNSLSSDGTLGTNVVRYTGFFDATGGNTVTGFQFINSGNSAAVVVSYSNTGTVYILDTSSSLPPFLSTDVGKKVVGNSGSAIITDTSGTYKSITPFADTSAISSWQLFGAEGKADGSGIVFTQAGAPGGIPTTFSSLSGPHTVSGQSEHGFHWSKDGTYYYIINQSNTTIYRYICTTPWDVTTVSAAQTLSAGGSGSKYGITVSEDGKHIYHGTYNEQIVHIPLSTAHDLTTAGSHTTYTVTGSYSGGSNPGINPSNANPWDMWVNSNGTKIWSLINGVSTRDTIIQFSMSTAYDISTASYENHFTMSPDGNDRVKLTNDGSRLYVTDHNAMRYWNLSPAYTLPANGTSPTNITLPAGAGTGKFFDEYYFHTASSQVNRYTLDTNIETSSTTPAYNQYFPALTNSSTGQINSSSWLDINSMTADETKNDGDIFYAVSTDNRASWSVAKASDGVRKIVKNNSGTWQYNNDGGTLVGFDYANATTTGNTLTVDVSNVGIAGGSNQGIIFSGDGTKFYLVYQSTSSNSRIYQVTLGTAWDLTSGTTKYTFNPSVTQISAGSIGFNQTGTALYIAWRAHPGTARYFKKFTLSTAWDLSTASSGVNSANLNSSGDFETCRGLTVGLNEEFIVTTDYASSDDHLAKFTFATAGDVTSNITKSESTNVTSYTNFPPVGSGNTRLTIAGPQFFDNGNKLFFMNYNYGGDAYIVNLTSPYDITSGVLGSTTGDISGAGTWMAYGVKPDGTRLYIFDNNNSNLTEYSTGTVSYATSETWVNGTNNNEHATLQQALTSQSFNRMDKAQLDAVADGYHFSQDSADTLDLMIAPYAASGTSPISDGVTINYDAEALVKQAINGTDYEAYFPSSNSVSITSLAAQNLKVRII